MKITKFDSQYPANLGNTTYSQGGGTPSPVGNTGGGGASGPAGGDLSGSFPDPTVVGIQGTPVDALTGSTTEYLNRAGHFTTPAGAALEVKEVDGSPDVTGVTKIIVSNGTLTDNSGGSVTIVTGGGGGGSDVVNVATGGAGSVTIPGLKGSPDAVPGSPGAQDDEFNALSGWTTLGTLDTSNVTDWPSHWHVKRTTSGVEVNGLYKAIPSMPFTVTAKLDAALLTAAAHPSVGIMLLDATATAIRCFELGQAGGGLDASLRRYTNRTTFSSAVDFGIITVNAVTAGVGPWWLRLLVTSSSSVTFSISDDGFLFTPVTGLIAIDPTITVTYVGLEISDPIGASTTEAVFDWIRFA